MKTDENIYKASTIFSTERINFGVNFKKDTLGVKKSINLHIVNAPNVCEDNQNRPPLLVPG
jgi:hypothetical protein